MGVAQGYTVNQPMNIYQTNQQQQQQQQNQTVKSNKQMNGTSKVNGGFSMSKAAAEQLANSLGVVKSSDVGGGTTTAATTTAEILNYAVAVAELDHQQALAAAASAVAATKRPCLTACSWGITMFVFMGFLVL